MAKDRFDHAKIEKEVQDAWASKKIYETKEGSGKPKKFVLDMFPYPSGDGLHVGHPKGYIATDIYSRLKKMQGFEVLHPMGWDAFGLPAENYALKHKVHPRVAVEKNIANFKKQLEHIGFNYDWSREINTTDPEYYRWTQWIFLQLYKAGLAFQSNEPINWCPSCMTGLANEDLESDGTCERCGSVVEKRALPQWVLKITAYADRMLTDLDSLEWPEHIKEAQRNWIGRSEGAHIEFSIAGTNESVTVFTTRPDTLYGATYLVLAPEHPLVKKLASVYTNGDEVAAYGVLAQAKDEADRTDATKEKTGVLMQGINAINPATKQKIPVYVADYVLGEYGTGAIMAVPAHDERDFAFAQKFNLPIVQVVQPHGGSVSLETGAYVGGGTLINSGPFDGKGIEEAKSLVTEFVGGTPAVTYKIKDWVFSRQRYWGEPIPVIHCQKDGAVAVPDDQLPVLLPEVKSYEPSGTGESPLATISDWVNTTCPTCGGPAKRETNTMPQWAGSSWYYLRFMDPHNADALVASDTEKYWAPVDVYVGGDHAVRHLIYARFWHKFLYDLKTVSTVEPFSRLEFLGFILAEDGRKMSKRYGNVINPDDVVKEYGADAFRVYEMFMGPFENTTAWSTSSITGTARFIERVWQAEALVVDEDVPALEAVLNQTIQKVGDDIEAFKFNTAVSQMMIFMNALENGKAIGRRQWKKFLQILAPFAPHVTEALWGNLGEGSSIHLSAWPVADMSALEATEATIVVQVNGKRKGEVTAPKNASEEEVVAQALALKAVADALSGKKMSKKIYVPGRILNLVATE